MLEYITYPIINRITTEIGSGPINRAIKKNMVKITIPTSSSGFIFITNDLSSYMQYQNLK